MQSIKPTPSLVVNFTVTHLMCTRIRQIRQINQFFWTLQKRIYFLKMDGDQEESDNPHQDDLNPLAFLGLQR